MDKRCRLILLNVFIAIITSITALHESIIEGQNAIEASNKNNQRLVILKLGGSSITDKAIFETLNQTMLDWVAATLANATTINSDGVYSCVDDDIICHKRRNQFLIVHGAGSFGHMTAKRYGLKGHTEPPEPRSELAVSSHYLQQQQYIMEGLAQTRLSVTKLNWHVVQTLLQHSLPAVGVSPFAVGLQAHGDPLYGQDRKSQRETPLFDPMTTLAQVVRDAMQFGLVPVLHGDAVLYGQYFAGILSGDTIVSQISTRPELTSLIEENHMIDVIFLTDVDGVYTSDPKRDVNATFIPIIEVDTEGNIVSTGSTDWAGQVSTICEVNDTSSGCSSAYEHDVTGGLQLKLKSAIDIAKTGIAQVYIVRCGSTDATKVIRGEPLNRGTVIRLANSRP